MSNQPTLPASTSATFSPASAAGRSPCNGPAGPATDLFGQALAPASPSAPPASAKAQPTNATSGRYLPGSSASAALNACLANRLKARLGSVGSMEFAQTWKQKATPSGRQYWAHTASVRPTGDKGCTGWLTPSTEDGKTDTVTLAGWGTPTVQDARHASLSPAQQTRDPNVLHIQVHGVLSTSCPAATAKRAGLNPAHSRWLMGFPAAWDSCGATAMQSLHKSPRNSSKPSSKP